MRQMDVEHVLLSAAPEVAAVMMDALVGNFMLCFLRRLPFSLGSFLVLGRTD